MSRNTDDAQPQNLLRQPRSNVKVLPPLPTGGLGLDFNGDTRRVESPLSTPSFVPPRKSSLTPSTSSFVSSPNSIHSASSGNPFPYTDRNVNQSSSTITDFATRSTTTPSPANSSKTTLTFFTPNKPPSSKNTTSVPTPTSSKRRIAFGMKSSTDSVRSGSESGSIDLMSSTTTSISSGRSPVPLSKKRSSGQLLMGLGKGLNRVGSVMRRNTAEGTTSLPPTLEDLTGSEANIYTNDSVSKRRVDGTGYGTWKKGRKWKTQTVVKEDASDNHKQSYDSAEGSVRSQGDSGDQGIGRPFNVEHDLHVSPDLADLPTAWLESLKAQGLTEKDLMLISAARRRQHEAQRLPLPDGSNTFYRAPLSAPLNSLSVPGPSDGDTFSRPSGKLLRKFSFEPESPTTPTASSSTVKHEHVPPQGQSQDGDLPRAQSRSRSRISLFDAFDPTYLSSNESTPPPESKTRSNPKSRPEPESYPVSAAESSDFDGDGGAETDDSFSPSPSSKLHRVHVTPASQESHEHHGPDPDRSLIEEMLTTPKKSKRFSDQLRGFKEHKFDLGEAGDNWGQSLLGAAWASPGSKVGTTVGTREESGVAVTSANLERPQISFTVPPPPLQEDDSLPTVFERSRIPENRPSALSLAEEPPSSSDYITRSPPPPHRSRDARHRNIGTQLKSSPSTPPPKEQNHMRKSSDSFGVHFHRSESKSSVELALVTPSSSTDHGGVRTASSDQDHEGPRGFTSTTSSSEEVEEHGERDEDSREAYKTYLVAKGKMPMIYPLSPALSNDGLALANQPNRLAPSPSIPTKTSTESVDADTPAYAFDWLNRPFPDLRRPPADPHYSLPASAAAESTAPSRASSPINEWDDAHHSCTYPNLAQKLIAAHSDHIPTREHSNDDDTGIDNIRADSPSSGSLISLPNPHPEVDPLEHLDQAGREERASIALSILSSRNSSDLHDLELGAATVRVAYKGHPGLGHHHWDMTRILNASNSDSNSNSNSSGEREIVIGPMSPQANSVCLSDDNSQEVESGTRDALDALGEAARRAFEPLTAH